MQWVALLPPQQHIPSPRLKTEAHNPLDSQVLQAKNDMRCSHVKASGVLHNPFDVSDESQ